MLRVAICITTHNRRVELARTLEEIAKLSPQPDEIRIIADGCTDGTERFVWKEAPHIILVSTNPAQGSIPARNAMGFATKCDVFLSLDDDSYPIETDAIERIRRLFEANARLAVAEFPQRTDERPASIEQKDFGAGRFVGCFANSGAAVKTAVFRQLGGYVKEFEHAYEEPDFTLRCCSAGWQVRFEPVLHIRHHFTNTGRSEVRVHHRHARNEFWSVVRHCPVPNVFSVAAFRIVRQFGYAVRRGWMLREPAWWADAIQDIAPHYRARTPIEWEKYRAWMELVRTPHDDAERWQKDFGPPAHDKKEPK